jgi:proteasome accessory factor B
LHQSQLILEENGETVLLEIQIHTTNDIIMELLKYGSNVKVLEPINLQNEMKKRILEMIKRYQ